MSDFKNIISLLMAGKEDEAANEFIENAFNSLNEGKNIDPSKMADATLIGKIAGVSFYEHPTRGDEAPLVAKIANGVYVSTNFWELNDVTAEDALQLKENANNSLNEAKWPSPTTEEPDIADLEEWSYDGVCEATDGCRVEPDGVCEHGHPSWMLRLGMI